MTIHELVFKVKEGLQSAKEAGESREIYTALLILLVGLSSFGLGRLSLLEGRKVPIQISNALPFESPQTASALSSSPPQVRRGAEGGVVVPSSTSTIATGGQLVASKGGTKYHFPWCSGAQRISEANKIWFDSVEVARKAGYTPASNCKGLK